MATSEDTGFQPIPDDWRRKYLKRPLDKLPGDLTAACDQIRRQRTEIDALHSKLMLLQKKLKWAKSKNAVLLAVLGGATAKGLEVGVIHLVKMFSR